jgi:polyisoprenoid-binding protein YceI
MGETGAACDGLYFSGLDRHMPKEDPMHAFDIRKILSVLLFSVACMACANPADNAPDAAVSEAVEPPAGATAGGVEYAIDTDSTIGFVGSKVTGSHNGGFKSFEGTITVVDGDPTKSRVDLRIDAMSLWADDERLTGHLKSPDFFEVETYTVATFTSTAIADNSAGGYDVTGNLELHGVTKSITFPATISVEDDRVSAQAEFSIQRFDFGIVYPGKADDLIRDDVLIRFDLTASPTRV